ncbi:subtilisin family serine protease [Rhizobium sp. BK077]|uniref:S8 family serine peptidase n=1 Tax=unclassified Rhizobium TaxID=2613769 RepID=UPI00160CDA9F|nr:MULTISPECIES: S8 family serine peptidase [unclassified Rhizobium]MBB3303308.1 subtilisin family serine protease [Rhizobium sp. BK112]MBB3372429.1 subtilisin family serine protease [Rhizobium sp. BK077]MBB4183166.1 subtilisin family serine protease [Rhizobium sp. BK109]
MGIRRDPSLPFSDKGEMEAHVLSELNLSHDLAGRLDVSLLGYLSLAIELGIEASDIRVPCIVCGVGAAVEDRNDIDALRPQASEGQAFVRRMQSTLKHERSSVTRYLPLFQSVAAYVDPRDLAYFGEWSFGTPPTFELDQRVDRELDRSIPAISPPKDFTFNGTRLMGTGVGIAICDGLVDVDHPSLKGRATVAWQSIDLESPIFSTVVGHATRVAGIAAGDGFDGSQTTSFIGVAPAALIRSYAFTPSKSPVSGAESSMSIAAEALQAAALDGMRIINLSWGVTRSKSLPYPPLDGTSFLSRGVDRLEELGICVVKSAGNYGSLITIPGDARGAITVGASDPTGKEMSIESARGPTDDGRIKPDIVAPSPWTAPSTGHDTYSQQTSGFTSFAAPVVSGMLAIMKEYQPAATPSQLRQALLEGARAMPETSQELQGYGLIQIEASLEALSRLGA